MTQIWQLHSVRCCRWLIAAWKNFQELDHKLFGICVLFSVLFLPIGLYVFQTISADWLIADHRNCNSRTCDPGLETPSSSGKPVRQKLVLGSGHRSSQWFYDRHDQHRRALPAILFAARQQWSAQKIKAFITIFLLLLTILKATSITVGRPADNQNIDPFCGLDSLWILRGLAGRSFDSKNRHTQIPENHPVSADWNVCCHDFRRKSIMTRAVRKPVTR